MKRGRELIKEFWKYCVLTFYLCVGKMCETHVKEVTRKESMKHELNWWWRCHCWYWKCRDKQGKRVIVGVNLFDGIGWWRLTFLSRNFLVTASSSSSLLLLLPFCFFLFYIYFSIPSVSTFPYLLFCLESFSSSASSTSSLHRNAITPGVTHSLLYQDMTKYNTRATLESCLVKRRIKFFPFPPILLAIFSPEYSREKIFILFNIFWIHTHFCLLFKWRWFWSCNLHRVKKYFMKKRFLSLSNF